MSTNATTGTTTTQTTQTETAPKIETTGQTAAAAATGATGTTTTAAPKTEAKTETPRPAAETPSAAQLKILQERSQLKKERESLEAERKNFAEQAKILEAIKQARAGKSPAKALEAAGWTAEEITDTLVNGVQTSTEDLVTELRTQLEDQRRQFEELKSGLSKEKEAAAEKAKEAERAEVEEYRKETLARISAEAEKFPFLVAMKMGPAIFDEMQAQYEKTGNVIDPEEAAAVVEKRMAEQFPALADEIIKIGPVRAALEAALTRVGKTTGGTVATEQAAQQAEATEGTSEIPKLTESPYRIRRASGLTSALDGRASAAGSESASNPTELYRRLRQTVAS